MCYGCDKCNKCGKFNEDSLLYIAPPKITCFFCGYEGVDPESGICPECGMLAAPAPGKSSGGKRAPKHDGAAIENDSVANDSRKRDFDADQ